MTVWARWSPGFWHRIVRRYDEGLTDPRHPWAPILTACGRFMREADAESEERPTSRLCPKCAARV